MKIVDKDVFDRVDYDVTSVQRMLISRMTESPNINDWEKGFLKTAIHFIKFTEKQRRILNKIYLKTK